MRMTDRCNPRRGNSKPAAPAIPSGIPTRLGVGPVREGHSKQTIALIEAKRRRITSEQDQDPDNEYVLFPGITYEADNEEAGKIYGMAEQSMDAHHHARKVCDNYLFPLSQVDVTAFLSTEKREKNLISRSTVLDYPKFNPTLPTSSAA
ncbi:hypothetical protein OF83DRAFT_1171465 [Amylostereum chailletii]|nr:hypothetical protein OF83DRAFT_1171465 [Amylostereum chailletii]